MQVFIELTLKAEQEEYKAEGIQWEPIEFFDNKIICELIEGSRNKKGGIIQMLDEECIRPGQATDLTFLGRMDKELANHKHFKSLQVIQSTRTRSRFSALLSHVHFHPAKL